LANKAFMRHDLRNKAVVVTGAASGIGRALATHLAGFGCQLALCDLNAAELEGTRAACEALGTRASSRVLDVSQAEPVFAWAKEVIARHGAPHLVFNNAGATLLATVKNLTLEELQWLMGVNFWGVVHGTKAFLPRDRHFHLGLVRNEVLAGGCAGVEPGNAMRADGVPVERGGMCGRWVADGRGLPGAKAQLARCPARPGAQRDADGEGVCAGGGLGRGRCVRRR
jgi:NAD(P)-dependent dehydrogenase (short-subunit alcohol dehydrogenase family)